MKSLTIDARDERMLELLAKGLSSRLIARQMGYREGTMRVYLHNMYRKIGVGTKTEAVIWHFGRSAAPPAARSEPAIRPPGTVDLFGDMAVQEDLDAALGVMSHFTGPFGRMWEVGARLKGTPIDAALTMRRARSRLLWRALLKGDAAYAKRLYDADMGAELLLDSPSDAVMLVALLTIGGYSGAADRLATRLTHKRKGGPPGATPREAALICALGEALDADDKSGLAGLQRLAGDKAAPAMVKQVALVMLFHAARARRDFDRARHAANAVWAEAEGARQQLHAMGERALGVERVGPAVKAGVRAGSTAREKVAATR
jgi:DNA-binding CsgD family transcriptional regulator